ncbi:MAG TPA: PilZ domain-containing protein [Minicystis sp.]|nr:PilZ domain-containing protein [Minicystis sp.]
MSSERRAAARRKVDVYFNKYIDGQPFVCEAIELSESGMLVRRIHEPDAPRACYAVEIAAHGGGGEERIWLCATSVWSDGKVEALGFIGQSERDKTRLAKLLALVA